MMRNASIKFMPLLLFFLTVSSQTLSQNNYIKAGLGFYTLYENNIPDGKERKISFYPGIIFGLAFSWEINNSFYISWENSVRSKVYDVEFIGLDTVANKLDIATFVDFEFINLDSKAAAKIGVINFGETLLFAVFGVGVTINLFENTDYTVNNRNVVLKSSEISSPAVPELFNSSGAIAELGTEIKRKNISLSFSFLIELNKTYLSNVGENKTIITQINILYNF